MTELEAKIELMLLVFLLDYDRNTEGKTDVERHEIRLNFIKVLLHEIQTGGT